MHARFPTCLTVPLLTLAPMAASAQVAEPLSPAPGRWVVPVSPIGRFNEPSIAVDPNHPTHVVATYQGPAAVAYSRDGGRTFATAKGTASTRFRISGDVSITYDSQGHAILCYIAFDSLGTSRYWGHDATANGIFTRRSLDGGRTWETEDVPVIEHATRPGEQIPFEDKPYIVADDQPHSPFRGNLYVGWTQDRLTDAAIMFSRSTDGGKTWSPAVQISRSSLPRDDNGMTEGFTGTVTPDGTLHTVWSGQYDEIRYASSSDGGKTFTPTRTVVYTGPSRFTVPGFVSGRHLNGYPEIAEVPGSDGAAAHLYVAWSGDTNGEVDVFAVHSDDAGVSWSEPVKVNSDPAHDGFDHFYQWLAADPVTGDVYVSFYDRRFDATARSARMVLARSTDGGRSFQNYLWGTDAVRTVNSALGDYTGLTALDGCVFGVWAETRPSPNARPADEPEGPPPTVVVVGGASFRAAGTCGP